MKGPTLGVCFGEVSCERIIHAIEDGEYSATPLDEASTKDEADGESTGVLEPTLNREGMFQVKQRAKLKVGLPSSTEELRRRLSILSNAMSFVKLKMSNVVWLKSFAPQVIEDHVKYILGPTVSGQEAHDANGKVVAKPSWPLILSYEYQIRVAAAEIINCEAAGISACFIAARRDRDIKERYFSTPMAVSVIAVEGGGHDHAGHKRKLEEIFPAGWWKSNKAKGMGNKGNGNKGDNKDKGSGKGSGKGGGKGPKVGRFANVPKGVRVSSATPDHKPICFKFNNGEPCDGKCGKVHCCQICFASEHVWPECDKMLA